MKLESLKTYTVASFLLLLMGCNAQDAQFGHCPVDAPKLRSFTPSTMIFKNNKVFFWKEGTDPEEMKKVFRIGKRMDRLNQTLAPVTKDLTGYHADLKDELKAEQRAFRKADKLKWKTWKKLSKQIKSITQKEIPALKKKIASSTDPEEKKTLQKEIDTLVEKRTSLLGEKKLTGPALFAYEKHEDVARRLKEKTEKVTANLLNRLESIVQDFDTPTEIRVEFPQKNNIRIEILGWDPGDEDGKRSFSTEEGSIAKARYIESGGKLSFEVYPNPGEVAVFQLARSGYRAQSGRVFLQGSVRHTLRDGTRRVGSVKLASHRN